MSFCHYWLYIIKKYIGKHYQRFFSSILKNCLHFLLGFCGSGSFYYPFPVVQMLLAVPVSVVARDNWLQYYLRLSETMTCWWLPIASSLFPWHHPFPRTSTSSELIRIHEQINKETRLLSVFSASLPTSTLSVPESLPHLETISWAQDLEYLQSRLKPGNMDKTSKDSLCSYNKITFHMHGENIQTLPRKVPVGDSLQRLSWWGVTALQKKKKLPTF